MRHNEPPLKVSVSLITYNHKDFIAKTIESVLMQKVDFDYEIIIGDDCSNDGTNEILKAYQEKYPDKIQLILHPRRYKEIPGRTNNLTNLYACRGEYIAMLDGDDYWISEDKLQKQVDFLENNPDFSLCFHNSLIFSQEAKFKKYLQSEKYPILNLKSIYNQDFIASGLSIMPASSLLFRNRINRELPEWFREISSADYALTLILTSDGKAKFFKDIYSAYRKNQHNFSFKHKEVFGQFTNQWNQTLILEKQFKSLDFSKRKAITCYNYSSVLGNQKSYSKMLYYMFQAILYDKDNIKNYLNYFSNSFIKPK